MNSKRWLKIIFACLATGALLYWCFHRVDIHAFLESFRKASWVFLLIGAVFTLSILFINSLQLKLFLPRFKQVSYKRMFKVVSVFSMTVNLVPFWGGHALLVYLIGQREKVGNTAALSVLTLEQIVEGLGKIFLFTIVVFVSPLPHWMQGSLRGFIPLIVVCYAVLLFLSFRFRNHREEKHEGPFGFWRRVYGIFSKWAYHLRTLRNGKQLALTVSLAFLMRFCEVLAVFFVQLSLGIDLGISAAFLIVAALSIANALPLTPGRLGIFEATALLTYQYLGVPAAEALTLGVLIHAVHTLPFVVVGYVSSWTMGARKKEEVFETGERVVLAPGEAP